MAARLSDIQKRIRKLQDQVDSELARRRQALGIRVARGRVVISDQLRQRHRAARMGLREFLAAARPLVILTAPVIYGMIVPFVILDIAVSLYQVICFPVYGIPKVRRRDHIAIDRHNLAYLNGLQKLNCVYCGYGNGLISYVREVAARTEAYWCPIKHARRLRGTHDLYGEFMDFGDEEDFVARWAAERERLKDLGRSQRKGSG